MTTTITLLNRVLELVSRQGTDDIDQALRQALARIEHPLDLAVLETPRQEVLTSAVESALKVPVARYGADPLGWLDGGTVIAADLNGQVLGQFQSRSAGLRSADSFTKALAAMVQALYLHTCHYDPRVSSHQSAQLLRALDVRPQVGAHVDTEANLVIAASDVRASTPGLLPYLPMSLWGLADSQAGSFLGAKLSELFAQIVAACFIKPAKPPRSMPEPVALAELRVMHY